jgi:hypothetical protein
MSERVTQQELVRARGDAAFRQRLLAVSLEWLLEALKRMRRSETPSPEAARQMRERVDLAVQLAAGCRRASPTMAQKRPERPASAGRFSLLFAAQSAYNARVPSILVGN